MHMARNRRKDARPAEIIAAALACFAERGYAATKLEDVAAAAGISKGTIYLYFPTKEELFRAVVRQAVLPNLEAAEAQFAGHAGSCADLLRTLAQRFLQLLDSDLTAVPETGGRRIRQLPGHCPILRRRRAAPGLHLGGGHPTPRHGARRVPPHGRARGAAAVRRALPAAGALEALARAPHRPDASILAP